MGVIHLTVFCKGHPSFQKKITILKRPLVLKDIRTKVQLSCTKTTQGNRSADNFRENEKCRPKLIDTNHCRPPDVCAADTRAIFCDAQPEVFA